jgi:hypothetical protein
MEKYKFSYVKQTQQCMMEKDDYFPFSQTPTRVSIKGNVF